MIEPCFHHTTIPTQILHRPSTIIFCTFINHTGLRKCIEHIQTQQVLYTTPTTNADHGETQTEDSLAADLVSSRNGGSLDFSPVCLCTDFGNHMQRILAMSRIEPMLFCRRRLRIGRDAVCWRLQLLGELQALILSAEPSLSNPPDEHHAQRLQQQRHFHAHSRIQW